MANALNLQVPSPLGSLDAYIEAVARFPLLSEAEEADLARRLQRSNDLEAARQLVLSHLRFVVRVARGYSGYGLAQGDLIQEGNLGLMKAVKRFDPERGVRLVSFAVHWVRAEIHEFILRNWRIVKVATTKAQRKLFFNLRSKKQELRWLNADQIRQIAQDLGVSERDVLTMEERLGGADVGFEGNGEGEEECNAPALYLEDRRFEPQALLENQESQRRRHRDLKDGLAELDERARDIVVSRWLVEPKQTLHELADKYEISAERVRQIEKSAFEKLKGCLTASPELPQTA
ncbi:MAG: RNA polymerase sigma factor RpoH [Pseudomonadota bacterium]